MKTEIPGAEPLWFTAAKGMIGQHENPAPGQDNEFILRCHATTTLKAKTDEVPWCSSFVNWCLLQATVNGTNSAAAASWLSWGVSVEARLGAITVIRHRTAGQDAATGSGSGYHVAFFMAMDHIHITLLGGNQSDSVKVSKFPLAAYEVVGYRWPA